MSSFLQQQPVNEAALPWLADAPQTPAPDWVRALRATGAEAFAATGLPTPAWEGWQHTPLRALNQGRFIYSTAPVKFDVKKLPAKLLEDSGRIVLVNGQYQPQLSDLPQGVTVEDLMAAAAKPGVDEYLATVGDLAAAPFKALNTAHLRDGFVLKTEKGADISRPLEVLFLTLGGAEDGPAVHPRTLYHVAENSGLTVLERHMGEGVYLANSHTMAVVEPAARLRFYKFEDESTSACHFSNLSVQQHKNSVFEAFSCAIGGRLSRQEFQNQLLDSGISSTFGGVYLMKDKQHHDFTLLTDHFERDGTSVQQVKGVLDAQARSVFQGKIHVRRAAQKTDGYQRHHALLLSQEAEASFKPELEIYADDVKCSHGATSGKLDDNALFYLQSRGIPLPEARSLLIQSFLGETLEAVSFAPVKDIYQERIRAWLAR